MGDATLAVAQANVTQADAAAAVTTATTNVSTAQAALDAAATAYDGSADFGTAQATYGGAVTAAQTTVTTAQTDLATAQTALTEAQATLAVIDTGNTTLTNVAAQSGVAAAAANALLGTPAPGDQAYEVEVVKALNTLDSTDATLQSNIDAEATTRAAADVTLQSNIDAVDAASVARDHALGVRIDDEQAARIASDEALSSRITAVEKDLRDEMNGSTAVAVAMGGGTFLPGKAFNLTVNLGTYEGQGAIAAQGAYRVSDGLAVSAAVATGFDKGGTAARAGVTLGW